MTAPSEIFRNFLQQQRAVYLRSLPGRLEQLETLAAQLVDPRQRAAALPALELCVHSLAGSAGTFGFPALGESARSLELLVEDARAGADFPPGPHDARLLAGVAAVREQLHDLAAAAVVAEGAP